jgi:hypothetical protein
MSKPIRDYAGEAADSWRRLNKWAAEFRVQWSRDQILDLVLRNAAGKGASEAEVAAIRQQLVG